MTEPARRSWTFLTNHAHVLICISQDPDARTRDLAERVGITERATQSIIADLVADGYLVRTKVGRRNHYEIDTEQPMRHPVEADHLVADLLDRLGSPAPRR